jgi:hypothetical protein
MKWPDMFVAVGAVTLILAGCGNAPRRSESAGTAAAADGNDTEGTTIRADMNGIRANIDLEGTDVRVGREGVSVNLDGGEIKATVRTGDNASVSITTNQR